MKKIFLTFADSSLKKSSSRIIFQARKFNFYDNIISLDENDLNLDFINKFKSKLNIETRGFGYWSWKPKIIQQVLQNLNEGDILQYTDVGCHLNINGKKRLEEYFELANNSKTGILAFNAVQPEYPLQYDGRELLDQSNYKWVKGDLLDYFNVRSSNDILNAQATGAGIIFIKKNQHSIKIISDWLKVIEENFSLIDDTESISENINGFIEHRHDQAIFSILCEINNVKRVSSYEYYYPVANSNRADWDSLAKFPIHAKRDKNRALYLRIKKKLKKLAKSINLINLL